MITCTCTLYVVDGFRECILVSECDMDYSNQDWHLIVVHIVYIVCTCMYLVHYLSAQIQIKSELTLKIHVDLQASHQGDY